MSTSGEAAEQVVRISLDGAEEILKITGKGAKELAKLLLSEMKKPQRTKGRASLMALLKQKKPMQVFEIDDRSLRKFCQVAKKYGVLYHVIKNTKNRDGRSEIMVRSEDLAQVNRIFDRFQLGVNRQATIKQSIVRSKEADPAAPEHAQPEKSEEEKLIDKLFEPPQKEQPENTNPSQAKTEKSRPSAPFSKTSENKETITRDTDHDARPSVRKQLALFRAQLKEEQSQTKSPTRTAKTKSKKKGNHNHDRI